MSMSRSVAKYFRIHPVLKQQFERFCGAQGLDQSHVLSQLISKWCDEHKDQVRLDLYISKDGSIIINQPRTVNVAIKAEVTYCKLELGRILPVLDRLNRDEDPALYVDWLEQLMKVIIKASRVQGLARDDELGELLAKAETHLT